MVTAIKSWMKEPATLAQNNWVMWSYGAVFGVMGGYLVAIAEPPTAIQHPFWVVPVLVFGMGLGLAVGLIGRFKPFKVKGFQEE